MKHQKYLNNSLLLLLIIITGGNAAGQKCPGLYCRVSPFTNDNRDYVLYYDTEDIPCLYQASNDKTEIIDSSANYQRFIYFGFNNDTLYYYDTLHEDYYKRVYPTKLVQKINDSILKSSLNFIRRNKLVENHLSFRINENNDIAFINKGDSIIVCKRDVNYDTCFFVDKLTSSQTEDYIHWLSNDELMFVRLTHADGSNFYNEPFIYNVLDERTTKVQYKEPIYNFWDLKDSVVVFSTKKDELISQLQKNKNGYFIIKPTKTIKRISAIGIYDIFINKSRIVAKVENTLGLFNDCQMEYKILVDR